MSDWRALAPEALERAYNARATVADIEAELQAYRAGSSPMYQRLPCQVGLRYGESPEETLDFFPLPGRTDAPLFVFIHGGYWRALCKEDSVFMAENFTSLGIAVAALDYSLAPAANLSVMVAQCRRAVAWLGHNSRSLGVDAGRMVVAGSSAGAHLAAMVLNDTSLAAAKPLGGLLVSGLFDLEPLRHTLPNSWLKLSAEQAQALSPQHHLPAPGCALQVVVAEHDTDEFKRQSRDYAQACSAAGRPTLFYELAGRNHFDVILDWTRPDTALTGSVKALLGMAA